MRNEGSAAIDASALVVAVVGWRKRGGGRGTDESGLEGLKREPLALPRSSNPLPCKRLLSLISYQRARAILAMRRDESLKVIGPSSRNTPLYKPVSRQKITTIARYQVATSIRIRDLAKLRQSTDFPYS